MITMTKRRNPTMRKGRRSQVLLEADQQKLIQGLSILEKEWNSYNTTSKPRRRYSSMTNSDTIVKSLKLLNNSPRSLMSSLQNKVIVRSNNLANEEIRRNQKAAIESGKLKGRRLFEAEESEAEVGFFGEREEVSSVTSYGHEGKGSSTCERSEEENVVGVNVEKVKGDEISFVKGGGGGRCMVMIKGWFCMFLIVFVVGVIFMRCDREYGVEDEVMLVPT